jgi:hypothetical protein
MITNGSYFFYNNNSGAEWGTGVLHSLQNCLRPACQVWWVRFPRSPAKIRLIKRSITDLIIKSCGLFLRTKNKLLDLKIINYSIKIIY